MDTEEQDALGTSETKPAKVLKYASEESEMIQRPDSSNRSLTLSAEQSQSMSLIGDTTKHLRFLMKEVTTVPESEREEHGLLPSRVDAAVKCATNIRELIRLQLDAMKEFRE